jgi:hypothetical protein
MEIANNVTNISLVFITHPSLAKIPETFHRQATDMVGSCHFRNVLYSKSRMKRFSDAFKHRSNVTVKEFNNRFCAEPSPTTPLNSLLPFLKSAMLRYVDFLKRGGCVEYRIRNRRTQTEHREGNRTSLRSASLPSTFQSEISQITAGAPA